MINVSAEGKVNLDGVEISISEALAAKLVDEYMKQFTEEEMNAFFKDLDNRIFEYRYNFDTKKDEIQKIKETEYVTDQYGSTEKKETAFVITARNEYNKIFCRMIKERIQTLLESDEYKVMADQVAKDILYYAVEGYKQDMIDRIRERLVGNVLDKDPHYCGISIGNVVADIMQERIYATR